MVWVFVYLNNAAYWLMAVDSRATEFTLSSRLLDSNHSLGTRTSLAAAIFFVLPFMDESAGAGILSFNALWHGARGTLTIPLLCPASACSLT